VADTFCCQAHYVNTVRGSQCGKAGDHGDDIPLVIFLPL
jgi:hypothetical protein